MINLLEEFILIIFFLAILYLISVSLLFVLN